MRDGDRGTGHKKAKSAVFRKVRVSASLVVAGQTASHWNVHGTRVALPLKAMSKYLAPAVGAPFAHLGGVGKVAAALSPNNRHVEVDEGTQVWVVGPRDAVPLGGDDVLRDPGRVRGVQPRRFRELPEKGLAVLFVAAAPRVVHEAAGGAAPEGERGSFAFVGFAKISLGGCEDMQRDALRWG